MIYEILHGNEHIDVSIGVWVYGYIDTLIDRDTLIGAPIHRYAGCVYRCMDLWIHRHTDRPRYIDWCTDTSIYSDTLIYTAMQTSVHQYISTL